LRGFAFVIGLIVILLAIIALVRFKIDLSPQRGAVAELLGEALGRPVAITGPIDLATSLWPAISVHGVRIGNPHGFDDIDFASLKLARLELGLLPLVFGNVHVRDITLTGLAVNLRENQAQQVNWRFRPTDTEDAPPAEADQAGGRLEDYELTGASLVLDDLVVEQVTVSYQDSEMEAPHEFELTRLVGQAREGKPMALDFDGHLLQHPFQGRISLASLEEFLVENRTWLEFELGIASTDLTLVGDLDVTSADPSARMDLGISGASLDSLNSLTGLDLPPLEDYAMTARMSLDGDQAALDDFMLRIGSSEFRGSVSIVEKAKREQVVARLTASRLQLSDFGLEAWSPEPTPDSEKETLTTDQTPGTAEDPAASPALVSADEMTAHAEALTELLSPEFLTSRDMRLELEVDEVLDGEDRLGNGQLVATLEKGRITLDPLMLGLPGGEFNLALSIKPGHEATDASLRVFANNFDFGLVVRRADPESDMGGHFSLDIDLKTRASSLAQLFENANGHFDIAARPVNLQAGIVDLWAVNLLSAIVTNSSKEPSQINCAIGRLLLRDGILLPETFVIDTTKIRICGKGQADFHTREFAFSIAPRAKRPEFFSLATPFKMNGSFDNFNVGLDLGGLVGTSISFITSPVHVPLRRLGNTGDIPADGNDICRIELNQAERVVQPTPGCRRSGSNVPADEPSSVQD
jgi:uncharacterized protein involved in outer membrane biogenesis